MAAVSEPDVRETLHPKAPEGVDPRVERSRELVRTAALELLGKIGYGELTIEAVAARSGVAKSTIYRHWGGKRDLVLDAFTELKRQAAVSPPPGPVRDRVVWMLKLMVTYKPRVPMACLPALIEAASQCEEMASVSRAIAEQGAAPLVKVLDEGVAAGELPDGTDTELLADALMGPIALRHLYHRPEIELDDVPALVDQILP